MTLLHYFTAALLATQSTPDSVTVAIYAAVLDSFFVRPGIQRLVIVPITAAGHGHVDDLDYKNGLKGLAPLPAGLQAHFELERRRRVPIAVSSLHTRVPSVPFTDADATALPRTNPVSYWEAFYRRYPDSPGVVTLSPVGVSSDGQAAMVMVDNSCGGLCGSTYYYLLEHREGRWVVARRVAVRFS